MPYVVGYYHLDRKGLVIKSGPYSDTKFDAIPEEAKSIISNFKKSQQDHCPVDKPKKQAEGQL
jgi:hypothetical protein